jgi:hypothetical protein
MRDRNHQTPIAETQTTTMMPKNKSMPLFLPSVPC